MIKTTKMEKAYHIGTSGWNYKGWKGKFYPPEVKEKEWLSFFLNHFDTVEINNSFYQLPKPETVSKWVASVPDHFRFCPKMNQYVTHMKKLKDVEQPLANFFNSFDHMSEKMGPVLVQLPKMTTFIPTKTEIFYTYLRDKYRDYAFAMEVRHESWASPESFDMMKEFNISWVISQSGVGWPYAEHVTAKDIYVRFHGPTALYASFYEDDQLLYYANLFKEWIKQGHRVWAFFNNDIHGYAPVNAKRLNVMMEKELKIEN